jgi:hypothetical protein
VCPNRGVHVHRCHAGSVHSHGQRVPDKVEVDVPQSGLTAQRPEPVAVQLRNEDASGLLQLKLAAARLDRLDIRLAGNRSLTPERWAGINDDRSFRSPRGHSSEQETHGVQRSQGSAVWARCSVPATLRAYVRLACRHDCLDCEDRRNVLDHAGRQGLSGRLLISCDVRGCRRPGQPPERGRDRARRTRRDALRASRG